MIGSNRHPWKVIVLFACALTASSTEPSHADPASTPASAGAPSPALPAVVDWKIRRGDFAGARADLSRLAPADLASHAATMERLGYAATELELAKTSASLGRSAEVDTLLSEIAAAASPSLAFREGVAVERQVLREVVREAHSAADRATLETADDLARSGDRAGAEAIYKAFLDSPSDHLPGLVDRARKSRADALREQANASGPVAEAKTALRTLFTWVLGLFVVWASIRALRAAGRLFPHAEPSIEIDDAGSPSDRKQLATREIVQRLVEPSTQSDGPVIDYAEDFDRSGLSNVSFNTHDFDALREIASSTERISIAGISFTPQQLTLLFLPFRRAYSQEFTGTLYEPQPGVVRLALDVRANGRVRRFSCEASNRTETLAEGADYIAFSSATWRVSESWPSFRAYRKALRLLENASNTDEGGVWADARDLLESSIAQDPLNVAAHHRLGVLLRRLGKNVEAAAVLERLRARLSERALPGRLLSFLQRNAEFELGVRYDLALCHAKQEGFDGLATAERAFRELLETTTLSPEGVRVPSRFALLAKGGLAAVYAGRLALLGRQPESRKERLRIQAGIVALREELERCRVDAMLHDSRVFSSAMAVALAAEGRGAFLLGDPTRAEVALRAARAENPRLACAAINLAQVQLTRAKSKRPELVREAVELLQRALELSPRNPRANFLLGNAALNKQGDLEAASKYLQEARKWGNHPKSDLLYAQCLSKQDKPDEALGVLFQSIKEKDKPVDYRYELFLSLLADRPKPAEEDDDREEWAALAGTCFKRIEENESGATVNRSRNHLTKIQAAAAS